MDLTPIPGVDPQPPAQQGLHHCGIVQYIGRDRTEDWVAFYKQLLGFARLPEDTRFGILPKGTVLQSPGTAAAATGASRFHLQLIEPDPATVACDEQALFHRIGLGTADVPAAVAALRQHGVESAWPARCRPSWRPSRVLAWPGDAQRA